MGSHRFIGHKRDVLSVAFSTDNRQIVSGSRDKSINVWNTIGALKHTMNDEDSHRDWVTCVQYSPNVDDPVIVSASRDNTVKVWNMSTFELKYNFIGHTSYVNAMCISPDGSLCASGGKDGMARLWDLSNGKKLTSLDCQSMDGEINALCFSPNRYWLCVAAGDEIKFWDLETKGEVGVLRTGMKFNRPGMRERIGPVVTCMAWSHDGKILYAGYTDHVIRVWSIITVGEDLDDNDSLMN